MNESGTNTDRMAIQRPARGRTCRVAPGKIARPARSHVPDFGVAPSIPHLPQYPPSTGVCQLASVATTLTLRESSPLPGTIQTTQNRVLIVGRNLSFPQRQSHLRASDPHKRYQDTKLVSGFKSLLTLLELVGGNLHDEKIRGMPPRSVD